MPEGVKPIPEGYHSVTPYLIVDDAAGALEFYGRAFGAEELYRLESTGGRIGHAEFRVGDSRLMLADEHPEVNARSPRTVGGSPVSLVLYVEDVDATVGRAVEAGATLLRPVRDQSYGERTGVIKDPFGHEWMVATHLEDLAPEELQRRAVVSQVAVES